MTYLGFMAIIAQVLTEAIIRAGLKNYSVYVALAVGQIVAWVGGVGLLQALDMSATSHVMDVVLCGVLIGGGSGLVEMLKRFLNKK